MSDTATRQPQSMSLPAVSPDEIVRVVFRGYHESTHANRIEDEDVFNLLYGGRTYKLVKGKDAFIPAAAAFLYVGDPRAHGSIRSLRDNIGLVSWVPDRQTEVRRLRSIYDNQMGDERKIVNYPLIEVYTLDGERVPTVLDDPSGTHTTMERASAATDEVESLKAQLAKQQATLQILLDRIGAQGEATASTTPPPDGEEADDREGDDGPDFSDATVLDDGNPPEDE